MLVAINCPSSKAVLFGVNLSCPCLNAATGMAAVGATGVLVASAYYGWDVVNRVAETLPWIGAAFYLLNDLVDIIDTKFELEVPPLSQAYVCCHCGVL